MGGTFANPRLGLAIAAGSGSAITGTVAFLNANSISFGASASASSTVITASTSGTTGGIQSISAGTTNITSGTAVLSNSNGVSFGASGQTITAGEVAAKFWQNTIGWAMTATLPAQSSTLNCLINRVSFQIPISATRAELMANLTASSAFAGSYTLSLGIYTMSHSTASLASSGTIQITWTSGTGNSTVVSQYGGQSTNRARSIPLGTWNVAAGEYLLVVLGSLTGSAANWTFLGQSPPMSVRLPGGGVTLPFFESVGVYSAATAALPASIQISDQIQAVTSFVPMIKLIGS